MVHFYKDLFSDKIWFGGRDSNPNSQRQRLLSYRLDDLRIIPQSLQKKVVDFKREIDSRSGPPIRPRDG